MDPQDLLTFKGKPVTDSELINQKKTKKFLVFRIIFTAIPVLLLAIVAFRFLFPENTMADQEIAIPVRIGPVEASEIELILRYSGNLIPESSAAIVPKTAGKVEEIFVVENDTVIKGQLLARMESDIVRLQAQQAEAAWRAAEAQYEKARTGVRPAELESLRASVTQAEDDLATAVSNFERTKNLYEAGTISKSQFEEAENRINSAQTEVDNANRSLQIAEEGARQEDQDMARAQADASLRQYELALLQLDYAEIIAPVGGRIAQILVDEGNELGIGSPIMTIVSDQLIFANIPIPEKYYGRFQETRNTIQTNIFPIAYPNKTPFQGSISTISEIIDPLSRTFDVEIQIDNSEELLKPGMFVNVEFIMEVIQAPMTIPNSAIVYRDGEKQVYVINGSSPDIVEQKAVQLGISNDSYTEVLEGLVTNELIVVEGNTFLENGQTVKVLNPELFELHSDTE